MNFFKKIFGEETENEEVDDQYYILVTLNDKIQPMDCGEFYEDDLIDILHNYKIGDIIGGGTMKEENGEIKNVDIEIALFENIISDEHLKIIIRFLENKGAPKNSKLTIEKTKKEIYFGVKEGIAIYLDGENLDDDVYESCDVNFVYSELKKLIGDNSNVFRYWQGSDKTAFYFYGDSFTDMKNKISEFVNEYPLCKNAEIKQIA